MNEIKVIGLDPSLNNTGIAVGRILLPSLEVKIDNLILGDTEKRAGKDVRRNSDDLRRAREIIASIMLAGNGARFAIAEVPTGSKSARASFANGICVGVLASLDLMRLPLIQVQPIETKLASVGKKTASKQDIIDWATGLYPDANWLRYKRLGQMLLSDNNEHLADAVAVIHAGIKTDQFRQAMELAGWNRAAA